MSIYNNFYKELTAQEEIIQYIEACCVEEEYRNTIRLLEEPIRPIGELYSDNVEFVANIKAKCSKAKDNISISYMEESDLPDWFDEINDSEELVQLIDNCVEVLECDEILDFESIKSDVDIVNEDAQEEIYSEDDIRKAISIAPMLWARKKNMELEDDAYAIDKLLATLNMVDITQNTNIYRQSFISIFSIFDAYVFDHLKKYYFSHIDKLEEFFVGSGNDKAKITFETAIKYSDMDALKTAYVEQKFDGKYIRQILIQLHDKHKNVFDGIEYKEIMEMVNRRNIHIHNQGIADPRYVEEYNYFGLNIGEYAPISKQYFMNAEGVLKQFILNIGNVFSI